MSFKEINFGMAAAEREKSDYPSLLIDGFLDENGYIDKIINESIFLVTGQKGSGKSAIGSKLELMSNEDNRLVVKGYVLDDFDYNAFSGLMPGTEAPELKYPNYWEFLLIICLLNSFKNDPASVCTNGKHNLRHIISDLEELNLIPSKEFGRIVKTVKKTDFNLSLGVVSGGASRESETKPNIKGLYDGLKEIIYCIYTEKKHIIVIDGLDAILTSRENQYQALTGLITIADRMNSKFKESGVNAKIIILCRNDLLDKLLDPNKNKLVQDSGITLDWYQDVKDVTSTNLYHLINLRASISLKRQVDVFKEFLPHEIEGISTAKLLFDNTRHTPRDIIQIMNKIKTSSHRDRPSKNDVLNGLRQYSDDYFIHEIKDEMTGFMTREEIENVLNVLMSMGTTKFSYVDLKARAKDMDLEKLDLDSILNVLYNCGAIGNLDRSSNRYTFKYRNRNVPFNRYHDIVIHRGLQKAMNLDPRG